MIKKTFIEIVKRRIVARTEHRWPDSTEELLIVTRSPDGNSTVKYDYYLSNAPVDTPLDKLAHVVKAEHRIEDSLKRAKSEAGFSDYEVHTWAGWYHHQTLSPIATWFLILETRRGKKYTLALTVPVVRALLYSLLRQACDCKHPGWAMRSVKRTNKRRESARLYHYKQHNIELCILQKRYFP